MRFLWVRSALLLALGVIAPLVPDLHAYPLVTGISPASVTQGNPGFQITVTGANFLPGDSVKASDRPVPTTYVSSTTLIGTIPASFLTLQGQLPISVRQGDNGSNYVPLGIDPPPYIFSATPQTVDVAIPGFTLTVVGSHFVPGCTIRIGTVALSTAYVSANELRASVPSSLLGSSGRFDLVVAAPDGPLSNPSVLIVRPGLISVGNVQIEGNQVTIEAMGIGFVPSDFIAVTANGRQLNLPTTFINSSRLRATATEAALLAGSGLVNVVEPNGVGSRFLPFAFPLEISSFVPGGAIAGGPSLTLLISGGIFPPGTKVLWNGAPLATVSSLTQLAAEIPSSLIASPGVATVHVFHPNGTAASMPYAINSGLTIQSLNPGFAMSGGQAFTLLLNGGGFLPGAVARWNGTSLNTTFISSTQLTAAIPASLIAEVGSATIGVTNPGGSLSNVVPFAITVPIAPGTISNLTPAAVVAGSSDLVLTVNGTGFVSGSSVLFNALPVPTTVANATQLVATVPAAFIATPGKANVSVKSGSMVSGTVVFSILTGPPVTSGAAVVNVGHPASAIAPGALISIYGTGLASGTAAAGATPLPNLLDGVSVTVNGIFAPLLYVSPTQINAQMPFEVPPGYANVVVNVGGVVGTPAVIHVDRVGPGVWSMPDGSHTLAVNSKDGTLGSPVAPGTWITTYLTGQGALNRQVPTGGAAPLSPLSAPADVVQVTIGGVPATNVVSAMAPNFVGLLQVNIQVPAVPPGDQPLVVSIGGVPSNVTLLPISSQ